MHSCSILTNKNCMLVIYLRSVTSFSLQDVHEAIGDVVDECNDEDAEGDQNDSIEALVDLEDMGNVMDEMKRNKASRSKQWLYQYWIIGY